MTFLDRVMKNRSICLPSTGALLVCLILAACQTQGGLGLVSLPLSTSTPVGAVVASPEPTREQYAPGQLVDYQAQDGDTLPAIAAHFNTTEEEIRKNNPILPAQVTTLPAGLPMKIPIYFRPLWGSAYHILPDSLFVNGPAQVGFDTAGFVNTHPGWLQFYSAYAADENRSGAGIVDYVATQFSISPRLLLAVLEYQTGALSQPMRPASADDGYLLGYQEQFHKGLYLQLVWAANTLNEGYYSWRKGNISSYDLLSGKMERPDPWQNAASVAMHYYYTQMLNDAEYQTAVSANGLAKTYRALFGDPWVNVQAHIPGSLEQPQLRLPFEIGKRWAFTGGPHTGFGDGEPFAAIDFAPPAVVGGCSPTDEWDTAVADGVIARSEPAEVILDLDGDGNEQTGWVIFYMHVAKTDQIVKGAHVKAGDRIGHPSCEGGRATGTHLHIARKYNGEWVLASGPLAFDLEGWVVHDGNAAYEGSMTRLSRTVNACLCSDQASQIESNPANR